MSAKRRVARYRNCLKGCSPGKRLVPGEGIAAGDRVVLVWIKDVQIARGDEHLRRARQTNWVITVGGISGAARQRPAGINPGSNLALVDVFNGIRNGFAVLNASLREGEIENSVDVSGGPQRDGAGADSRRIHPR